MPHDALLDVWNAYHFLHPSRAQGMGPGAIPVTEILAYLDLQGIDDAEERREFAWLIRQMDAAYLEEARKQQNTPKEQ